MDLKNVLSILAAVLMTMGFFPYIHATWRGNTKPAKTSWMIWATLDSITLGTMHAENAANGQIIGSTIGSWITVILALKYGTSGWTKLDKFCLAGAISGITIWQLLGNPLLALGISLGIIFLGSIPTFASAWKNPNYENKASWTLWFTACAIGTVAIPRWTFEHAAQPIVFLAVESVMMYLLFIRPKLRPG